MGYLVMIILTFVVLLLIMQIIFFEVARNREKKADNIDWFSAIDRPFQYNRVGYMIFICLICYVISSPEDMFTLNWFIYFVLFVAMGIVADAIVQYLVLVYSKIRCRKEIQEAKLLENELLEISQTMHEDYSWKESEKQYEPYDILHRYIQPTDHIAFMSVDEGEFAKNYTPLPEATFILEPYGDSRKVEEKFADNESVKVTQLTEVGQLPFKDDRLDALVCEKSNYDKVDVKRILKDGGYFIVHQNGTANLKEFLKIYMPFAMRGSWDAYQCAQTLEEVGFKIREKFEDYGSIRFYNLQSLHQYFMKVSPDLADMNRYKSFYLKALRDMKKYSFFEMTTHTFMVVAQK